GPHRPAAEPAEVEPRAEVLAGRGSRAIGDPGRLVQPLLHAPPRHLVDDRLPLAADGLAVLVLDDLRVPALALVLGPVHAVGVDRVAGVARVAEDTEHGRAVPWPVLGDGLRRESFRGS